MNYGMGVPTSNEAKKAACATQQYVWEQLGTAPSRSSWTSSYMSSSIYSSWLSQTESYYNQFHGNVSFNTTTQKATLGQTTTITDTANKLSTYDTFSKTINGITFSHSKGSNDLSITVDANCTADKVTFNTRDYSLYQLLPNGSEYNSSTMSNYLYIHFQSGSVQNLMFSNYVDPSTFSVSVEVEYGNALLIKTNTNGDKVAGCKFGLYKDENCTQLVRTGTSSNDGQIEFERLAPGDYYVKELSVPEGYLLDTSVKKVTVKANETSEVTFKNDEPTGEIKLIKTDAETGNQNRVDGTSHHGDATIEGTEYTLYAKDDIYNVAKTVKYFSKDEEIATYTFDGNGIAKIKITTKSTNANLTIDNNVLKGLPIGSYYAKETKTMEGYLTDNETHTINLNYKDMNTKTIPIEVTYTNQVEKAKFEVIKVSSITNTTAPIVEGAEFTAILTKYVKYYGSFGEALKHLDEFSEDEYSVFTTGTNGHGISGLLAYGNYTVNETYCPSNQVNPVKEFYVTIDKNSSGAIDELVENDTPFQSYLKMIKIDKKTGKQVTFSNTTFSLYKLNTDTNEWEKVSCKLGKESYDKWTTDENGVAYTETKLDAGTYKLDEIVIPTGFLELEEECIFEINRDNETLEYDEDYDAYITITVGNEQPTGTLIIDKSVALKENVDTSFVDVSDLSKIKFKLFAKEDIIDMADGSVIYEEGAEIGEYNLSKEGDLTISNLPIGTYEFYEIETLDGLVLDETKYEVKFTVEDTTTKVYTDTREVINDTTYVEISKQDITGEEIEGAKLQVIDENGNIVDEWTSTKTSHSIEGLLVDKTYTLHEEVCVDEYVKTTDVEFTVTTDKETQKITMIDKIVEITKTDLTTGEELEGAELEVIDKDTGEIVDKWTSTKEPHKVTGLEEGKTYILKETTCPYGYEQAEEIEFTVSTDKETQKIEMKDMPILKSVRVEKLDKDTKEHIKSNKFVFGIYEDAECTKLIKESGANEDEGTALFEDLRYGTYYIKEIKAPTGYKLSDQVVKIEINENGVFADEVSLKEKDGVYSFEYYNSLLPAIQTGNETNYPLIFGLMGISLIGVITGIVILKKRNNK